MNLWVLLYRSFEATGRLAELAPEEQFTLADGLPVLFLHDIEKPWRSLLVDGKPVRDADGSLAVHPELAGKPARKAFAECKLTEFGIEFSPRHRIGSLHAGRRRFAGRQEVRDRVKAL